MAADKGAYIWVQTFLDQCKTGMKAELQLVCENGHLKVNLSAELGPIGVLSDISECSGGLQKGSPSRVRRRERRASERAAAERTGAAEKATVEKAAPQKAAVKEVEVHHAAAEKAAAEKVDFVIAENAEKEMCVTEEVNNYVVAEETATEKTVMANAAGNAGKVPAAKAADESAAILVAECSNTEQASTSSTGGTAVACWNCSGILTPHHQCDEHPGAIPASPAPSTSTEDTGGNVKEASSGPVVLPPASVNCCNCGSLMTPDHQCEENISSSSTVLSDAETVAPPRRRGLNINTFCVKCEKRHPVWQRCQCQSVSSVVAD